MLQLFVNDLSVHRDACSKDDAITRLKAFCSVLKVAHRLDETTLLNSALPVAQLQFGEEWPLAVLRNDRDCLEEHRYLKRLQDRAPFDFALAEIGGGLDVEYTLLPMSPTSPGQIAMGLGLAHHANGLSISFDSHQSWRDREIALVRRKLDDHGEVVEDQVAAANASSTEDVEHHRERFHHSEPVNSGVELWARRAELFPCLDFIPRTRSQIEGLLQGEPQFQSVIRKLTGLNDAIGHWRKSGGDHPVFPFKARPESESRITRGLVSFNDAAQVNRIFN